MNKSELIDAVAAAADLTPMSPQVATYTCQDSRLLPLPDGSVDYVFTDPPYGGEGVQYGELVLLWSLWLGEERSLEQEVAFLAQKIDVDEEQVVEHQHRGEQRDRG